MADRGTRRIALVAAAVALLTLAPGCYAIKNIKNRVSTWRPFTSSYDDPLANEKLAKAHEFYNTGEYSKAYKIFKELADNQGNSNSLAEEVAVDAGRIAPCSRPVPRSRRRLSSLSDGLHQRRPQRTSLLLDLSDRHLLAGGFQDRAGGAAERIRNLALAAELGLTPATLHARRSCRNHAPSRPWNTSPRSTFAGRSPTRPSTGAATSASFAATSRKRTTTSKC